MHIEYVAGVSPFFNSIFKASFGYDTADPWMLFLGLQFLASSYSILKARQLCCRSLYFQRFCLYISKVLPLSEVSWHGEKTQNFMKNYYFTASRDFVAE